jgi:hypothetical protein
MVVGTGPWFNYPILEDKSPSLDGRAEGYTSEIIESDEGVVLMEQCWASLDDIKIGGLKIKSIPPKYVNKFCVRLGSDSKTEKIGWAYVAYPRFDAKANFERPLVLLYRAVLDVDCSLTRDVLANLQASDIDGFEKYYKKYLERE